MSTVSGYSKQPGLSCAHGGSTLGSLQGPGGSAPTEQEKAEVHSEVRPQTGELSEGGEG